MNHSKEKEGKDESGGDNFIGADDAEGFNEIDDDDYANRLTLTDYDETDYINIQAIIDNFTNVLFNCFLFNDIRLSR